MKFISSLLFGCSCALLGAQPAPLVSTQGISANRPSSYLATMKQRLSINSRERDPFGLSQDLRTAQLIRNPGPEGLAVKTFAEVVTDLPVTGVSSDGTFLIGARELSAGQLFSLEHERIIYRVRVLGVTQASIKLQNCESGKIATRVLKLHHGVPQDQAPISFKGIESATRFGPLILIK